jgi:hypothetical protein
MTDPTFIENIPSQEGHPQLTPESVNYLASAAKWGKFLAILGFISIAFLVLAGLLMGVAFSVMGDKMAAMGGMMATIPPAWISAFYIIIGVIGGIPVYLLNSFSNNVSKAIRNNNTTSMTTALKRLKGLFAFIGIYTIVLIAIYIIVIIAVASTALLAL